MKDVSPRAAWLLLAILVACGGAVRLHRLDHRPLGHVEAYTPGIEFPEGVSAPSPRVTFRDAVRGSLDEVHPPVWYALAWPWTRLAGTSLSAMRLPSALLGTLCIVLVFLLGSATRDRVTGLVAAALIAGHGHHYFWSQMSRPSILGCALSLTATLLLLRIARSEGPRPGAVGAFLVISLLGLGNSYYYWPLFGAQVLWIWGALARRREQLTGLFRWSATALVAATPIAGLAIYQSSGRENYLGTDTLRVFGELVGLCFPFHRVNDDPHAPFLPGMIVSALPFVFGALVIAGLAARKRESPPPGRGVGSPAGFVIVGVTLLAAGALAGASVLLGSVERHADKAMPVAIIAAAPLVAGALLFLESRSGFLSRLPARLAGNTRGVSLVTLVAVLPPAVFFTLNLAMPFLVPRHMLVFTPYLLILMATGITATILRLPGAARTAAAVAMGLAVATVLAASVEYDFHRSASVTDYSGAAAELLEDLREDDVVFMTRHWVNTPFLYYTRHLDREWVWRDWKEAMRARADARVWLVWYEGVPPQPGMKEALAGHSRVRAIERKNVTVELWQPR